MAISDNRKSTDSSTQKKNKNKCEDSVVVSSRIRLARNLDGENFPNWANEAVLISVFERVSSAVKSLKAFDGAECLSMDVLPDERKEFLVENRMISADLANLPKAGVIVNKDSTASVMINEEDHLRIQVLAKGQKLAAIWKTISAIDSGLEKKLNFAFSEEYGYLTACPSNFGTGMRASLMMHLPALALSGDIEKIIRGVNQIGMTARGENGEGSEAVGSFFQISNQQTLGVTEEEIISKLIRICKRLHALERNARQTMLQKRPLFLADKIQRAWATLNSCLLTDSAEAIGCISFLRLACDLGLFKKYSETIEVLDSLILKIKPAHLGEEMFLENPDSQTRDAARAKFVKKSLEKIERPDAQLLAKSLGR